MCYMKYCETENYWTFEATDVYVPAINNMSGSVNIAAVNMETLHVNKLIYNGE